MMSQIISKPIYQVLSDLTQEPRVEVALPLAIKDWVRLKLNEATQQRLAYERRYDMDFFSSNMIGNRAQLPINTRMRWSRTIGNGKQQSPMNSI
jgi:hypothetical protein